jgi:hypothetical protein
MGTPPDQRLRQPELYRPGRDTAWRLGPPQRKWRGYHSTALLLPDGRVLSAGDDYWSPTNAPDPTVGRDLAEIYRPPYLFAKGGGVALRPRITSAPATLRVGGTFRVGVTGRPARAVLMAPAAVTHGNDMNQRHVELRVVSRSSHQLTLQAPPSAGVAPPGWYMLFVLDGHGTPSVARWLRITTDATRPQLSASLAAPDRRGRPAWLRVALGEPGTVRVDARAGRRHTRRTLTFTVPGRARRVAIAVPRRARLKVRLDAHDVALNRTTRTLRSHG